MVGNFSQKTVQPAKAKKTVKTVNKTVNTNMMMMRYTCTLFIGKILVLHTYINPKSYVLLNIVFFGRISLIDMLLQHAVP